MHPVEHILYFSVVLPHMFIFGHPLHLFFNAQHTALTPAGGHHGFDGPICDGQVPTGSYFHYLHHRYFECNYGEATIPLDKWFGTFRDGKKCWKENVHGRWSGQGGTMGQNAHFGRGFCRQRCSSCCLCQCSYELASWTQMK